MEKIKKSDHFYLIDGSGYIFRAYYALPPLTRKSDGLPVGAVSGFCNMLFKLLEDSKSNDNLEKPTHFAVIFDSARKNFRNEIYSEYISFLKFFLAESNITAKCVGFSKLSSDLESSNNLKSMLQKPLTAPTGNPSLFLVKGGRA